MLSCIGYHGTKPENVDSILRNGYKMSKASSWFGVGIYFFGDLWPYFPGEREAIQWMLYVKNEDSWAVFVSEIESTNYFDMLGDISAREEFDEIKKELLKKHTQFGKDERYFKDNAVFELLENTKHFSVIRALVNARKSPHVGYVVSRPQVQICVKDISTIVSTKLTKTGQRHAN